MISIATMCCVLEALLLVVEDPEDAIVDVGVDEEAVVLTELEENIAEDFVLAMDDHGIQHRASGEFREAKFEHSQVEARGVDHRGVLDQVGHRLVDLVDLWKGSSEAMSTAVAYSAALRLVHAEARELMQTRCSRPSDRRGRRR